MSAHGSGWSRPILSGIVVRLGSLEFMRPTINRNERKIRNMHTNKDIQENPKKSQEKFLHSGKYSR